VNLSGPPEGERATYFYVAKWKILLGSVLLFALALGAVLVGTSLSHRSSREFHYVVPNGTTDRITRGEKVALFPSRLTVHVGDTLVVENKDVLNQHVGPFFINPRSTLRMTFSTVGTIQGSCTLNPQGQVTITMLAK